MTIDERIEALTQSVELLSLMHQDNEKRFAEFAATASRQISQLVTIAERLATIAGRPRAAH